MKNVEQDPDYRALLNACLDELVPYAGSTPGHETALLFHIERRAEARRKREPTERAQERLGIVVVPGDGQPFDFEPYRLAHGHHRPVEGREEQEPVRVAFLRLPARAHEGHDDEGEQERARRHGQKPGSRRAQPAGVAATRSRTQAVRCWRTRRPTSSTSSWLSGVP